MPKCIIYARFSPRRNQAECQSIETQIDIISAYCQEHGYEVAGTFTDAALSGKSFKRPGLWEAIKALKRDWVLVVYSSSRLARNLYLSEYIYDLIAKRRAFVDIVDEGGRVNTDPMAVCMRQVRGAFDELDRKMIGKRTSDAAKRYQKNGRAMSKIAPYGYKEGRVVEGKRSWMTDIDEQSIINQITAMHDFEGMGLRAIARQLNKDGFHSRGSKWTHTAIGRILAREGCLDAKTENSVAQNRS